MAERTGSPTATYEALLGRSRLQSLQYDVAQAGKIRGQRDNLMTRMQGLDKQLYSFEQGKSFGRGGGWAAWFQAMNGVLKIQAGEKQNIRKLKTTVRTKFYDQSQKNEAARNKFLNSSAWERTTNSSFAQLASKSNDQKTGADNAKALVASLYNQAGAKSSAQKEALKPIVYKYVYDMLSKYEWSSQGKKVGDQTILGAQAYIRDTVQGFPDGTGLTPDEYLQKKLPVYTEEDIEREVDKVGGGIVGLDRYKRLLWESQPTGGALMGTAAPKATDSAQNKQKFFGQTYQVSPDGKTVTYIGPTAKIQQALDATGQEDLTTFEKGKAIPYDQAVKKLQKQNATLSKKTIIAGIKSEKDALQGRIAELDKQIAKTPYVSSAEYSYRTTPYAPVMLRRGVRQGVAAKAARRVRGAEEAKGKRIEAQVDLADTNADRMLAAVFNEDASELEMLIEDQEGLLAEIYGPTPDTWGESGSELDSYRKDLATLREKEGPEEVKTLADQYSVAVTGLRFKEADALKKQLEAKTREVYEVGDREDWEDKVPDNGGLLKALARHSNLTGERTERLQTEDEDPPPLLPGEEGWGAQQIELLARQAKEKSQAEEARRVPEAAPVDSERVAAFKRDQPDWDPYKQALIDLEQALAGKQDDKAKGEAERALKTLEQLGKQSHKKSAKKFKKRLDAAKAKQAKIDAAVNRQESARAETKRQWEAEPGRAFIDSEDPPDDVPGLRTPAPAPQDDDDITFGDATSEIKVEEPKAKRPKAKPPKAKAKPSDAESRRLFKEGRRLYEADDFKGASKAFSEAWTQLPDDASEKIRNALAYNVNEAQKRIAEAKAAAAPAPTPESTIPDIAQPTTLKGFDAYSTPFQFAIYDKDKATAESILKKMREQAETFFAGELGPGDRGVVERRLARYEQSIKDLGDPSEDDGGDTGDFGDTGDSDDQLLKEKYKQ